MINKKCSALCLQLFAEAADGTNSGEAENSGEALENASVDAGQSGTENADEFMTLIEGKFKKQFSEKTQAIIDRRFKETKEIEAYKSTVSPLVSKLCEKYGVADGDTAVLSERLENETLRIENDTYKSRETLKKQIGGWLNEGEALKESYPDFDLKNELHSSREFAQLLKNGIPVKTAYEVVHHDDILGGAMAYTAKKVREQVVKNIEAKGQRPLENGIAPESGIVTKTDVNALTSNDILKILKKVENGASISF